MEYDIMSTVTKYMTHFNSAAEGYIALEATASGLANELYNGLVALATEFGTDNLLSEYDKVMIDVENTYKEELVKLTGDSEMTLAKHSSAFKVRKSELRRGIKAGLDPTKFVSFSKFRKGIATVEGGNASGTTKVVAPTGNGGSSNGGGAPNEAKTSTLAAVTSGLTPAVQDKLNLIAKHLDKLDEASQLKVLADCDGAIHKLAKVGGRFSNVNRATA